MAEMDTQGAADQEDFTSSEAEDTGSDTTASNESYSQNTQSNQMQDELSSMRAQQGAILNNLNSLNERLTQTAKPAEPAPMSGEQLKALYERDPDAALRYVVSREVKQAVGEVRSQLTAAQQKDYWDNKADRDFPQLRNDKAFQQEAAAQLRELTEGGEYTKDSPKLVFRAAERAALKLASQANRRPANAGAPTTMSGEAPRGASTDGQRAPREDKNFNQLVRMFGIKDVEGMRKKYDADKTKRRN